MISSPSAQIVNAIAESHLITSTEGKKVSAYGPTMGIATAIIAIGIIVTTAFGSEKRGRKFETVGPPLEAAPKDLEAGGGLEKSSTDGVKAAENNEHKEHSEKV
jgi:hypothetical protein